MRNENRSCWRIVFIFTYKTSLIFRLDYAKGIPRVVSVQSHVLVSLIGQSKYPPHNMRNKLVKHEIRLFIPQPSYFTYSYHYKYNFHISILSYNSLLHSHLIFSYNQYHTTPIEAYYPFYSTTPSQGKPNYKTIIKHHPKPQK